MHIFLNHDFYQLCFAHRNLGSPHIFSGGMDARLSDMQNIFKNHTLFKRGTVQSKLVG